MARGNSGRVIVEVEPLLKSYLHAALALQGLTMKEWFEHSALDYLMSQGSFSGSSELRRMREGLSDRTKVD